MCYLFWERQSFNRTSFLLSHSFHSSTTLRCQNKCWKICGIGCLHRFNLHIPVSPEYLIFNTRQNLQALNTFDELQFDGTRAQLKSILFVLTGSTLKITHRNTKCVLLFLFVPRKTLNQEAIETIVWFYCYIHTLIHTDTFVHGIRSFDTASQLMQLLSNVKSLVATIYFLLKWYKKALQASLDDSVTGF